MSYFAAVLSRGDDERWSGSEVDLDDVETLVDLGELVRDTAGDDPVAVLLVEQEDEWFGVVRADADDDPRVFVSDAAAAVRHALGELLLRPDDPADEDDELHPPPGPGGEVDVVDDLGAPGELLAALAGSADPADAAARIADQIGAGAVYEAFR